MFDQLSDRLFAEVAAGARVDDDLGRPIALAHAAILSPDMAGAHSPTLILLGDCDLREPLRDMLGPLFTLGWRVHWILGNKDAETETAFDNLAADFPEGDIGGRVIELSLISVLGCRPVASAAR